MFVDSSNMELVLKQFVIEWLTLRKLVHLLGQIRHQAEGGNRISHLDSLIVHHLSSIILTLMHAR